MRWSPWRTSGVWTPGPMVSGEVWLLPLTVPRFAQWNHSNEVDKQYLTDWVDMLEVLLETGCNIVDIGAHGGDTTLPLAVAARGGTVVAFEMGPPIRILELNKRL